MKLPSKRALWRIAAAAVVVVLSTVGAIVVTVNAQAAPLTWRLDADVRYDQLPNHKGSADILSIVFVDTQGGGLTQFGFTVGYTNRYGYNPPRWHWGGMYATPDSGPNFLSGMNSGSSIIAGRTYHLRISMLQNGSDVDVTFSVDGVTNQFSKLTDYALTQPGSFHQNTAIGNYRAANVSVLSSLGVNVG